MSYLKMNKPIEPDDNVWLKNPWMKIHPPYSKLYQKYGEELSSKYMIAIYLFCDPDENDNPFYRQPEEDKKKYIKETYVDINWKDKLIIECFESYPFDCMDTIERAYKEEKDKIRERARFIRDTQYTLDIPKPGEDFDKEYVKMQMDTIKLIEGMQKNTLTIYKQYDEIEQQYILSKTASTVEGGGKLFKSEEGLI